MDDREVMKLALDALENHEGNYKLGDAGCYRHEKAITALREALAEPPAHKAELWIKRINDAVLAEREACAKVCEPQEEHDDPLTAWKIANAIRARGQA